MAYDSLKALIRQYIKTNGEQEITGQILQNVLVEMVNQYPSTDGFATQSWVTSQGYATTSQLADYLPLTGGELTGYLIIDSLYSTGWNAASNNKTYTCIDSNGTITSILIAGGSERSRTTITPSSVSTGAVNANSFVVSGGTSAQFLKADGSVDSNAYITSAALSGYATQSWVTTQLGDYLPLTGGTLTGVGGTEGANYGLLTLSVTGHSAYHRGMMMLAPNLVNGNDILIGLGTANSKYNLGQLYFHQVGAGSSSNRISMGLHSQDDVFNILASGNVGIGTTSPAYKLDVNGSTRIGGSLIASSGNLWIYSAGGSGGNAVVFDVQNSLGVMFNGGFEYFFDAQITAPAFNNTSDLRKKTITGDVPINLYNVANAPLFKFTWKDEKKYSGQHVGSAAQYWQTVLPELVSIGRDADMTLAMQYDVIALASAITVAKTVVNHEERIILLERENEALKKEIADLKSA